MQGVVDRNCPAWRPALSGVVTSDLDVRRMLVFNSPWYLLLLVLLPADVVVQLPQPERAGPWRRLMALALRTVVLLLIVAALAEMQYQRTSDRLTVIYLLDQSLSIPEARRAAMIRYVNASIREQRKDDKGDRAGVIVFGRNAEVEVPPVDFNIQLGRKVESLLDPRVHEPVRRDAAGDGDVPARRGQADRARDRRQPEHRRRAGARPAPMADAGVSIDVMPVPLERQSEVAVEKVALPADVRRRPAVRAARRARTTRRPTRRAAASR